MKKKGKLRLLKKSSKLGVRSRVKNISSIQKWLLTYALNLSNQCEPGELYYDFILSLLSERQKRELRDTVMPLLDMDVKVYWKKRAWDLSDLAERLAQAASEHKSSVPALTSQTEGMLAATMSRGAFLDKELAGRFLELQSLLELSNDEVTVIQFLFCQSQHKPFENFCEAYTDRMEVLKLISTATGLSLARVKRTLQRQNKLISLELIEADAYRRPFDLHGDIVDFLVGLGNSTFAERYYRRDSGSVYPLHSFTMDPHAVDTMLALLKSKKPAHFLLYGEPGTGKTEFARSIARKAGLPSFCVMHGDDGDMKERRTALVVAANLAAREGGVVILDEADDLINTRHAFFFAKDTIKKGWLNDFIDRSRVKIIWIANRIDQVEDSVRRRFSYSLPFEPFTIKQRMDIYKGILSKHPLKTQLSEQFVRDLAIRHKVNASGIALVLDSAHSALAGKGKSYAKNPEVARLTVQEILMRHEQLLFGKRAKKRASLGELYDPSILHMDANIDDIISSVKKYNDMADADLPGSLNLLFWGPPGTGKTELARFLAETSGRELLVKRGSDLLNPFVGVTEQQIRQSFEQAERDRAILLIDEADSFFADRKHASHNWEASMTNELLSSMEDFRGILICSTNLLDHVEKTAMRRFHWKVRFKPLREQDRLRLFVLYFTRFYGRTALGEKDMLRLRSLSEVTPGDYKAVFMRLAFSSEARQPASHILDELEKEVKYKKEKNADRLGFRE